MLKLPKKNVNLKNFFQKLGLSRIYKQSIMYDFNPKDKRLSNNPYPPDLLDLYYLYELIRLNKRITILEYGCGWSTVMIHFAIKKLQLKMKNKSYPRNYSPYQLTSLDNDKKFISISKKRLDTFSQNAKEVNFFYSKVSMTTFNDRYCSKYDNHPLINPDFIYVDGPDQFNIKGKINNFTINSKIMVPIISDILRYEHFLMPGTIILFDGRQSNVRFFKTNLQRKWIDFHVNETGQHIFFLDEKPLGKINKAQLDFYKKK
jgi:hypothetical protein